MRAACRAYTSELPPSPPPPPPPPQLEKKAPTGRLLSRRVQVARGEPQPAGRARFKVGNLSRNFSGGKATGAAPGAAGRPPPGGPGRAPAQEMAAARPPRAACPKGRPHEPLHGGIELTGSRPAASGGAGHGKPWRAEVMCDPRRPPAVAGSAHRLIAALLGNSDWARCRGAPAPYRASCESAAE